MSVADSSEKRGGERRRREANGFREERAGKFEAADAVGMSRHVRNSRKAATSEKVFWGIQISIVLLRNFFTFCTQECFGLLSVCTRSFPSEALDQGKRRMYSLLLIFC